MNPRPSNELVKCILTFIPSESAAILEEAQTAGNLRNAEE
jgi:hypothetical protein